MDALYDVIVVGAGPAGSSCAALLARSGLSVLLVDRSEFPREKICGCCINPACWPLFHSLEVASEVSRTPAVSVSTVRFVTGRGAMVRGNVSGTRPFLAMRRSHLDELLLRKAISLGAEFMPLTRPLHMSMNGVVTVALDSPSGRMTVSSRFLVGADGRNSAVASWIRQSPPAGPPRRVAFQWFAAYQTALGDELLLATVPSGYFGIVNVDETTANIAIVIDVGSQRLIADEMPDRLNEWISSSPELASRIRNLFPQSGVSSAYPINPRGNTGDGKRVFLAGDARQTVEPLTGEGILFALSDGITTASDILDAEGIQHTARPRTRSAFVANQVASPLLRRPNAMDAVIRTIGTLPGAFSLAVRTIVR